MPLSGYARLADGVTPASNVDVDVYVLNPPYRRTYKVRTGADGNFATTFTPVAGEGGHYAAGASYPDLGSSVTTCAFDILGMARTSSEYVQFDLTTGETKTREVEIRNLSTIALTGLTVELCGLPVECEASATVADVLPLTFLRPCLFA